MKSNDLNLERTPEEIISGALFDFVAFLSECLPDTDPAVLIDALVAFADDRKLTLNAAEVLTWHLQALPHLIPEMTDPQIIDIAELRLQKPVRRPR